LRAQSTFKTASQNGGGATGFSKPQSEAPIRAGGAITGDAWHDLRLAAMFDCCKWDVQSRDHSVLATYPLFLDSEAWNEISRLAESLSRETLAAERELFQRAELHAKFGLPPQITAAIRRCAETDLPNGVARVMRFDFHFTRDGWRISEANSDVPGGFVEASGFTKLVAKHFRGDVQLCGDPAGAYADALAHSAGGERTIALVHATWHSDDRQVMEYIARRLREIGVKSALLAPDELEWHAGEARRRGAAGKSPLLLARFFPAEWLPRIGGRSRWEPWFRGSRSPLSNPATAVLVQSKRFPLVWDALRTPLTHWRTLLPETRSVREMAGPLEDWVLKPTLGRVGEDVAIEGVTATDKFRNLHRDARRNESAWVAQRRFDTIPIATADGMRYPCIGVFTIDGRTAGAYGRVAAGPIVDQDAQDAAVLVRDGDGKD
jgi:glutathionylspermidine synthase